MATLNRYECIGNLGKDPDMQVTNGGTFFTRFTVAVSQGKNNPALWWNCVSSSCLSTVRVRLKRKVNRLCSM